jgi:hypothetical protein
MVLVACGGGNDHHSNYPPKPKGCAVQEFMDEPTIPVHKIGGVSAICGRSVTPEDCTRTLEDEVCKLGGDVLSQVHSSDLDDKTQMTGRAGKAKP